MLEEKLLEKNLVPDLLIRFKIRRLLGKRIQEIEALDQRKLIQEMVSAPIALSVDAANQQHYEVPALFFTHCLGPRMKYSCAFYENESDSLKTAEEAMLALTCKRAEIVDGQKILELGCGWGSLTLWMAEHFPKSKVTGVSNSASQKEFILNRAKEKGLTNIEIITQDMNIFKPTGTFDRVISIEMFEHMRNIPKLLKNISDWLSPEGKLFVHIFTHKDKTYFFEDKDESDWMSRYFFTGGMMPSHQLYQGFNQHLSVEQSWIVPGTHYSKTAEHWLENMDENRKTVFPILQSVYGNVQARLWWARWRVFFMACSELWRYKNGTEWFVSHYLFKKNQMARNT